MSSERKTAASALSEPSVKWRRRLLSQDCLRNFNLPTCAVQVQENRQYQDKPAWNFLSPRMGYARRLPNGNTLITKSEEDEVGVGGDEHGGYVRNRLFSREGAFFYRVNTP
jgi:hypothetical protein